MHTSGHSLPTRTPWSLYLGSRWFQPHKKLHNSETQGQRSKFSILKNINTPASSQDLSHHPDIKIEGESLEDVNQCLPRQTEEGNQKNTHFVHAFQKVFPFSVHKCTPPPSVNIHWRHWYAKMDQAFPTVSVSYLKLEGVRLDQFTWPKVQSQMRLTMKLHTHSMLILTCEVDIKQFSDDGCVATDDTVSLCPVWLIRQVMLPYA